MDRIKLNKFIQQSISEQGSASSKALTQLCAELIKYVPCVIYVSGNIVKDAHEDEYEVINSREEINSIIDAILRNEVF